MENNLNVQNEQQFTGNQQQSYTIPEPQKMEQKNPIVIALCVIIAVAIGAIAIVGVFLASDNKVSYEAIVQALEEGRYIDARELHEKKYGYGNSDENLVDVLENRLITIETECFDGTLSYNAALKEIEAIRAMGIESLEDNLQKAEDYIESVENNTATNSPGATEAVSFRDAPDVNLGSEPLPTVAPASSSPRISSATTLNGVVLAQSDVNAARSFGANKAVDGYYDSCWCVNTQNTGAAGASIRFNLTSRSVVSGVMLVNGNLYHPEDGLYMKNGQIESFTLTFSDGTSQSFTASYNSGASSSFQQFYLSRPVETDYVTLTVDSGYVGSKFTTNVCLGEFEVF